MVTCSVNLLVDACNQGDLETVREFLNDGRIDSLTEEGESLLSAACSAGCFFLVEMILDMGADIEDRGHKDTTPLMEAANNGHPEIVKLLIDRKASVNAQTNQGNTPLILASANGHTECVGLLLEAGARTEEHNDSGHTALMEASSNGHVDVAKLLISKGASINTHSHEFKETALTLACYKGQLEMVKFLLEAGADQEHKTEEMHTALMEASMDGHVEVARLLLDSGAQVTMPAESFESPLTLAACGGHVELAMLLLERGANIEEVNDEGYTPLMEAAREGHEEMVALLLSQGADINAQTEETLETALTLACCGGFLEVVDFLIKAGADISMGANTPLMEASQEGHLELVKYLIVAGADVNASTSSGDTPLMYACDNGHTDVAEVLIAAGANIEQEAEGGRTPLMKSCRSGHSATVEFLISRGADVNKVSTNCDQTPLSLSCSHGHLEVVEILLAHGADPTHRLRDSSTMLIEAAKGGHTPIVQLLIDYPASLQTSPMNAMLPSNISSSSSSSTSSSSSSSSVSTHTSGTEGSSPCGTSRNNSIRFSYNDTPTSVNDASNISTSANNTNISAGNINNNNHNNNNNNNNNNSSTVHSSTSRKTKMTGKSPKSLTRHARQNPPHEQSSQVPSNSPSNQLNTNQDENQGVLTTNQQIQTSLNQQTPSQSHVLPAPTDPATTSVLSPASWYPPIEVDSQTDSNHDTALTVACSGGHEELVQLLLNRGPDVEHRDKKGFTSLMLAATAGHAKIVEILLNHHAELEAQSERTKDTALSLACSSGRYEVVEILLARGANKEHRNVSDYTPLSLAASGGYVAIIKLLLTHGAEINSRTGSKLGISPLMLAAMNGHTSTVKLLLDMGSDINAQIETNRNTALTLACFQGRVDVVSLLLDRKANVEHRAKTGLTPLMEAASGGFVDVGRVLLDKGADVNALPVPSSRDTALTIASDKGHCKFVELLLNRGASFDVKNKKGNSPLWLACNGGHIDVVNLLIQAGADVDSQDNRKISCLMAGFRRGHVKVVKLMVRHVTQFPSDQEINRFMALVTEKDMTKKCIQCMEIIHQAKERQAAEANKHASILLQEIDLERSREEIRKAAAARRREKKRQKKKEKQEQLRAKTGDTKENAGTNASKKDTNGKNNKQQKNSTIAASQVGESKKESISAKNSKQQKNSLTNSHLNETNNDSSSGQSSSSSDDDEDDSMIDDGESLDLLEIINRDMLTGTLGAKRPLLGPKQSVQSQQPGKMINNTKSQPKTGQTQVVNRQNQQSQPNNQQTQSVQNTASVVHQALSSAKDALRKNKKVIVPASAISRVIGRGGCNINAVREVSCAHIEVEKQKGQADRGVIIKGTAEATRIATQLIYALINDSNKDLNEIIKKLGLQRSTATVTSNPSKYMSTSSSMSSSSSSKSNFANQTTRTTTLPTVGVWTNATAANMVTSPPTQSRSQPQRSVRSPMVSTNYTVPSSVSSSSYLVTSSMKDRNINTYLQPTLPVHNQASSQQPQIKSPSEASIAAIAQQIAAVGQRQQSQYDSLSAALGVHVSEALVPSLTESLLNTSCLNETINGQNMNIETCVVNQSGNSPRSPALLGAAGYEPNNPANIEAPISSSSSSNQNIQPPDLADYGIAYTTVPVTTPEYSPFDNLFSKVAQTSVWQQNVTTSVTSSHGNTMFAANEAQDSLRHLPNLKPIGTERKSFIEQCMRTSMMNLPPYNQ